MKISRVEIGGMRIDKNGNTHECVKSLDFFSELTIITTYASHVITAAELLSFIEKRRTV